MKIPKSVMDLIVPEILSPFACSPPNRSVATILQEASREVDICGRYGGEEFVVVLPDTNIDGAINYCERLRIKIEEQVVASGGHKISYTVSLGAAMLTSAVGSSKEWIVGADKALYQAKDDGRNCSQRFN
ncbi:MAG: GGDEF domain-containing protein [Spongiibacteraceae bacterium]|nr:GGDEF domain-containing protein [Spongiibacteraceae bacterium]